MLKCTKITKVYGDPIPGPPIPEQALPPLDYLDDTLEQLIDPGTRNLDVKLNLPLLLLTGHHVVNPDVQHDELYGLECLAREYPLYHLLILCEQLSQVPAGFQESHGCLVSGLSETEDL